MLCGKMINRVFRKFLENIHMIQGYEAFITLYMRHVSKIVCRSVYNCQYKYLNLKLDVSLEYEAFLCYFFVYESISNE